MDLINNLVLGFGVALTFQNLLYAFFGAVLGNLAEETLMALWNGPVAQSERQRALQGRLCARGPVTCVR